MKFLPKSQLSAAEAFANSALGQDYQTFLEFQERYLINALSNRGASIEDLRFAQGQMELLQTVKRFPELLCDAIRTREVLGELSQRSSNNENRQRSIFGSRDVSAESAE